MNPDDFRVDRTAFSVFSSHEEAEEADRQFWWSRHPHERVAAVQTLRRRCYGDEADARLQRVLEVVRREPR